MNACTATRSKPTLNPVTRRSRPLRLCIVPLLLLGGCAISWPLPGCEQATSPASTGSLEETIAASFHPAAYVAGRIAAGLVPVREFTPSNVDVADWSPDADAIERLQRTRLIVVNGAGFEPWTASATLPEFRTCTLSRTIADRLLDTKEVAHSHGGGVAHVHRGVNPHTWMDPALLALQARSVLEAMSRTWPNHEKAFAAAHDSLAADLAALDARLASLAPSLKGVVVIASHPSYSYLARRHGWDLIDIDLPPDGTPSADALSQLDQSLARDAKSWVVLFEQPPEAAVAAALAARPRLKSVVYDPCEHPPRPGEGDFLAVMNRNIDRLAESLGVAPLPEKPAP